MCFRHVYLRTVTCYYLHGCACLNHVPFPRVTCYCHVPFPRVMCYCHVPFPRITCQSSDHLTVGGFRGGYHSPCRGRGVCLWLCRRVIGDMWGAGAATSCARDTNALNELTLNPPPEPDNWREEELDRLSRLATFIAHIDRPFLTSERLEFPVIDWEIPSSLRHLPHSTYSLRSPRALQDLRVGIIPPTSIRGLHFGFGTETLFQPPFAKVFRTSIEGAILREDFWNRAVLNVPDSVFMSSLSTRPSSSIVEQTTTQRSPSPPNHLSTLTTQEVKSLPDIIDQSHSPRSFPEQETRSTNDDLHPGCPWVKANAYSFHTLPLVTRHFETQSGNRPLPFVQFRLKDNEPFIFGTEGDAKEVYEHPLISEPSRVGRNYSNINPCEDLYKLKVDYPFNHLVQLAFIAIGDPGVMADIYWLKSFKHHFQELQVQCTMM